MSDRPQKQASKKADQSTFGSGVVVISLLMELLIGDEDHSLPLCAYMSSFGKVGHIQILAVIHQYSTANFPLTVLLESIN